MYEFSQEFEQNNELLASVTHLLDTANELELDTDWCFVNEQSTEQELKTVAAQLQEQVEQALSLQAERDRYACHIGPYSNGICEICGGNEPRES